jgi:pimeloyl-ACP methyl ester carboxylesterase
MIWTTVVLVLLLIGFILYIYCGGPALPPDTDRIIETVRRGELPELIAGQTGWAESDGLAIWYESIAPPGPPKGVVMLLMGMGGDALFWPSDFIRAFTDAGYQLIRYDHRGAGMSDWVEKWDRRRPYSLADMAGDAAAVLTAVQAPKAHLVGLSMGGMIAQEMAIRYPEKVASLTLMMTSGYVGDPGLPGPSSRHFLQAVVKGAPLLRYRLAGGEKNLIKEHIANAIAAGDENVNVREIAELVLYGIRKRRGLNLKAIWQHQMAVTISGSRYEGLKEVQIPALVVHGVDDQLMPIAYGRKLVEVMPQAQGLWLEGVGHTFPVPDMPGLMAHILAHFERAGSDAG